jgi:hypothetical protein
MSEIPTKWAVVEFGWGEGKKHIYSLSNWDVGYYPTEEHARAAAKEMIADGEAKMMAVMEVKALLVPKAIDFTETV